MNKKLVVIASLGIVISACAENKGEDYKIKSAFLNACVKQQSSSRSEGQAKSYCDCVADAVFGNKDISVETKKLMPTMNDKDSQLYKQSDAAKVRGALMSCYTAKFYKK
ncbi:hypothetical protein [Methylomarinum vadi]|uniref:hypothetical protein n=1 Tax=Methylomarinum vadi TaxID=438855 RepID=UPI0004DF8C91|nr:hypothetical protein [Methylomarinum vadi]